jgi:putative spermidine/putrescine transport system permease protein
MGARWTTLFVRVLFPNLRTGILAAAFLTVALSLGEFAIASLVLPDTPTFPVWLVSVDTTSPYITVALSVVALIVTWGLLGAISVIGSGRRRGGAGITAGIVGVTEHSSAPVEALEPAEALA